MITVGDKNYDVNLIKEMRSIVEIFMNRSKMSSPSTPCPFIGQVSVYCPPVQLYSDGHGTGSVVEGSRNDLVESGDGGDTTTTIHLSGGTRSRILRE